MTSLSSHFVNPCSLLTRLLYFNLLSTGAKWTLPSCKGHKPSSASAVVWAHEGLCLLVPCSLCARLVSRAGVGQCADGSLWSLAARGEAIVLYAVLRACGCVHKGAAPFAGGSAACRDGSCRNHCDKKSYRRPKGSVSSVISRTRGSPQTWANRSGLVRMCASFWLDLTDQSRLEVRLGPLK